MREAKYAVKVVIRNKIEKLINQHHHGNASDFAKRLGVSPGNVSRWLKKTNIVIPAAETCWIIAKEYDLDLNWFLSPFPAAETKRAEHGESDLTVAIPLFSGHQIPLYAEKDITGIPRTIHLTKAILPRYTNDLFAVKSPIISHREGIREGDLLVCSQTQHHLRPGNSVIAEALSCVPAPGGNKVIIGLYACNSDDSPMVIDDDYLGVNRGFRSYLNIFRICTVIRTPVSRIETEDELIKLKLLKKQ
jgi:transcriptional regulator with XRE-family HTH domain